MSKYILSLFVGALAGIIPAAAITVDSRGAGTLREAFSDPSAVLVLKINGEIDASDLFFIESSMPALTSLDLSDASITAYKGKALRGFSEYAPNLIPTSTFASSALESVVFPSDAPLVIGEAAFAGSALAKVEIPLAASEIRAGAFSACPRLTNASTGGAVLHTHAFAACPALTTADLGSAKEIPASAFAGCTALNAVSSTAAVDAIGPKAFAGCTALEAFDFGKNITLIGEAAFENTSIAVADLSRCTSLDEIASWAFAGDKALTAVILPEKDLTLGEGAFFQCAALTELRNPAGMIEIPAYAFKGDRGINAADLMHQDLTSIGDYALKDVSGVAEIALPASLEYIGTGAMEGMTALKSIDVRKMSTVPELGDDVWKGLDQSNIELFVKNTESDEFADADQWKNFKFMISTGINNVVAPEVAEDRIIEARFEAGDLRVRSRGSEIAKVDVYRPSGELAASAPASANDITVATAHIAGHIFIVECTLADGTRAALKLLRK